MEKAPYRPQFKVLMLVSVFILICFSLPMLYSTSAPVHGNKYFFNQTLFVCIGASLAFFIQYIDYNWLCRNGRWLLVICCVALLYLVLANVLSKAGYSDLVKKFPLIKAIKGSYRWFRIGGFGIQPAEFTKIGLVLVLAEYYHHNIKRVHETKYGFVYPAIIGGVVMLLILLGGSLSMTVLTGTVILTVMFVAGTRLRWLLACIALGIGGVLAIAKVSPVRASRFESFLTPEELSGDKGYQLWHSLLSLGSGGWTGQGFSESRMKNEYLPEAHTDFILAIVGEELGFLCILFVCFFYLLFLVSSLRVAGQARNVRGVILAATLGCTVVQHAFVNMGVICGLLPTTGITAPFISYGGSSMVSAFISVGLLMSVDRITSNGEYVPEKPSNSHVKGPLMLPGENVE
ncbi:putative peptidoglycan glycosyltransferase FtsW [Lentisphaera profundi]|uniref:Probable peptidoglycan glycosyltransferase FtsW n=1 Tax=Lentisphaera profundi TaxID=1658616 RepID=A0ABY7VN36_9BACT|nr:putative peptidoglycan glycosyltransferase FtsW [Lentisphaera profundi]WDE95496.1 putative peptidoglycan glycosyltransferase FtsW [Lentisphaera profundi]